MGKQVKKHGYSCKLVRVVYGDTCDAMIDLGFDVWVKNRIRFYGVDTWESRTRDLAEKEKGLAAKARNKELLEAGTFKIVSHGTGKFGRVLGDFLQNDKSVAKIMCETGHAVAYFGGAKADVQKQHMKNRQKLVKQGVVKGAIE